MGLIHETAHSGGGDNIEWDQIQREEQWQIVLNEIESHFQQSKHNNFLSTASLDDLIRLVFRHLIPLTCSIASCNYHMNMLELLTASGILNNTESSLKLEDHDMELVYSTFTCWMLSVVNVWKSLHLYSSILTDIASSLRQFDVALAKASSGLQLCYSSPKIPHRYVNSPPITTTSTALPTNNNTENTTNKYSKSSRESLGNLYLQTRQSLATLRHRFDDVAYRLWLCEQQLVTDDMLQCLLPSEESDDFPSDEVHDTSYVDKLHDR